MHHTTIELTRIKGHWAGYALMTQPFTQDSSSTMGALCAWSAQPENRDQKVYRHALRIEQERVGEDGLGYKAGSEMTEEGKMMAHQLSYDIPLCDLVYYLDIWHQ